MADTRLHIWKLISLGNKANTDSHFSHSHDARGKVASRITWRNHNSLINSSPDLHVAEQWIFRIFALSSREGCGGKSLLPPKALSTMSRAYHTTKQVYVPLEVDNQMESRRLFIIKVPGF